MTVRCSHCSQPLSRIAGTDQGEPTISEVFVCAHCDLRAFDPAALDARQSVDVDVIVDLFDAAIDAEDEGRASALRCVAIGAMESRIHASGGFSTIDFERVMATLLERHRLRTR